MVCLHAYLLAFFQSLSSRITQEDFFLRNFHIHLAVYSSRKKGTASRQGFWALWHTILQGMDWLATNWLGKRVGEFMQLDMIF